MRDLVWHTLCGLSNYLSSRRLALELELVSERFSMTYLVLIKE